MVVKKMSKNVKQEVIMCICIDVNRYINKQKHKNVLKNIQNDGGRVRGKGGEAFWKCFIGNIFMFLLINISINIYAYSILSLLAWKIKKTLKIYIFLLKKLLKMLKSSRNCKCSINLSWESTWGFIF